MENRNKEEFVDIPKFFMPINYRESVIVLRQISYHFSLPITLRRTIRLGDLSSPSVSAK